MRRAHLIAFVLLSLQAAAVEAGTVTVAVASNFARPAAAIARAFEAETGHEVRMTLASTGKLYAQIENGAPFDVLLAADAERPRLLEASGRGIAESRFTYAIGALTLWSRDEALAGMDCRAQLSDLGSRHLAIANPLTAPYGVAAQQFLRDADLWPDVEDRLVFGENIAQTLHFVATGNASLGLIASAQALDARLPPATCEWSVPQGTHAPLEQQAILLKRAADNEAAVMFVSFLQGPIAVEIVREHGYATSP